MRTIFITSFHSIISRNILATGVLPLLQANGVRIVILYPENKKAFFQAEFTDSNITIVPIITRPSRLDSFLRYLSLAALNTKTLYNKRRTELQGRGVFLSVLIAYPWSRPFLRALSSFLTPRKPFTMLLTEYMPDLIFSTDIQNEFDIRLSVVAHDTHIPVVSMVRSWDNLTSKGLIRFVPDTLIVNNEVVREEAIALHGIKPETIQIVGIPHYDAYVQDARTSRDDFFKRVGGDPQKKTILFVPTGDRYLEDNTIDRDLLSIVLEHLPEGFQILVRLPPADRVRAFENVSLDSRVILDRPITTFVNVKETELGRADDIHLADTLYYSDIVVSGPSTMCIDAAVFDKPIILFGFDGFEMRPYLNSIRRYYDYDHFKPVLVSGGVTYVSTKEEFVNALVDYIANPKKDEEGRKKLVSKECFRIDGHSSERLTDVLIGALPTV